MSKRILSVLLIFLCALDIIFELKELERISNQ